MLRPTPPLLEADRAVVGMAVDLDPEKYRQAEPDTFAPEHGAVPLDVSVALETPDAAQARRGREADAVGELKIAQPCIRLQGGENSAVDCVKFSFWHE